MSGRYKALLIDIGNSQIKYALVNQLSDTEQVLPCSDVMVLADSFSRVQQVLVACVGKPSYVDALQKMAKEYQVPIQFIQTQAESFGVRCAYQNFNTLGVDRWLAILAAEQITSLPCAVLDLGTANTCDILVAKQHTGGWIAPGFSLMRESLLKNTQHVFADDSYPDELIMGQNTQACVSMGCLAAQIGLISMAEKHLANQYQDYILLICGGSQDLTQVKNAKYFKNLVIKGLFRFISK